MDHGFGETRAIDFAHELAVHGWVPVIYTDIARDSMLNGPESGCVAGGGGRSSGLSSLPGGITRVEDLQAVQALGPACRGAIVRKALCDGKLDYRAALSGLSRA